MASPTASTADGDQQPGTEATASSAIKSNRKRTKTGCLTCRKRRIKCDESKPSCRNCIKSKRQCEGYNQRVVFKPPTFDYQPIPNGSAHITFQAGPVPGPAVIFQGQISAFNNDTAIYAPMPPRALEHFVPGNSQEGNIETQYHPQLIQTTLSSRQPLAPGYHGRTTDVSTSLPQVSHVHVDMMQPRMMSAEMPAYHSLGMRTQRDRSIPHANQDITVPVLDKNPMSLFWNHDTMLPPEQNGWAHGSPATTLSREQASPAALRSLQGSNSSVVEDQSSARPVSAQTLLPDLTVPTGGQVPHLPAAEAQQAIYTTPEYYDHELHPDSSHTPTFFLTQGAVQTCDDDYYDVASDEEMDEEKYAIVASHEDRSQVLGQILKHNHISARDLYTRRYDTFIPNGMLDKYNLEWVANPLKNAATARIFAHFIAVTGPSLSIFERQPRNTSVLFTHGNIPFSQQGLWTYTMPIAALHNQGLLHAMLAIASLHIARLTGASVTPSLQHYVWATKRVHADVGHPKKRLQVATIGASMLLGFYEVMTADHIRWNTHLAGSSKLFVETDFADMTRQFKRMKQQQKSQAFTMAFDTSDAEQRIKNEVLEQILDVDERMISEFVGKEVRYEDHGQVVEGQIRREKVLDLAKFEIVKDLYWWYCKQDVYQAILSGDGLLRWANCPPRAPLGRLDAVYGSFDHLLILLARIADFTARDRPRKLRQISANGGRWLPAREMNAYRPQQQQSPSQPLLPFPAGRLQRNALSQHPSVAPLLSTGPAFYGMAPPPRGHVRAPTSYGDSSGEPTPRRVSTQESENLQAATHRAIEEYGRIRAALHTFSLSLGEYYKPFEEEHQVTLDTPFGPAKFYRAYDISCLWAIWNMAVIIAIRSHPHMPPAAHMAAAVAKNETMPFANEIGRIVAGIVPGPADQPLNPSLGAALCESCMPSFFAAVQYEEAEQRHSTVMRIYSIAQRTGWGSAELIANGCETAWVKGAARGGPPYVRVVRPQTSDDPRLNGSWERLNPQQMPKAGDQGDRRLVYQRADARVNWAIDVLIVGAGPCGLSVAARLRESHPSALFTDEEQSRYHWISRHANKASIKNKKLGHIRRPSDPTLDGTDAKGPSMMVIDSSGSDWMAKWNRLFNTFQISHLRSPMFFHPDPGSRDALLAYAYETGRSDELQEIAGVVGKEISKHRRKKEKNGSGFVKSSCVDRYGLEAEHVVKQEVVQDIDYGTPDEALCLDDSCDIFTVRTNRSVYFAKTVVLAVGAGTPSIPQPFPPQISRGARHAVDIQYRASMGLVDPSVLAKIRLKRQTNVLVIGGGLTSAQVADALVRGGTALDANSETERLDYVKEARNGGSITPRFMKKLKQHTVSGKLAIHTHTSVASQSYNAASDTWDLTTNPPLPDLPPLDYVYFATGAQADIHKLDFLQTMHSKHPIDSCGGLPVLTDDLMWREDVPLFVTGRLATLRIGPGAGNLEGARAGAERVAWAIEDVLGSEAGAREKGAVFRDGDGAKMRYAAGVGSRFESLGDDDGESRS
nr:putative transcriptional regulatory protein c15d4.02 [Quercus suber]POF00889.1 putative transcriptional regulatory protein c15d4.02 [Quercus suber]